MNPPEPAPDYSPYVFGAIVCLVVYSVALEWLSKVHVPESIRAAVRWFATVATAAALLFCWSHMHEHRLMPWWMKGAAFFLAGSLGEVLVAHWSKKFPGKPPEVVEGPGNRPPGPTPG